MLVFFRKRILILCSFVFLFCSSLPLLAQETKTEPDYATPIIKYISSVCKDIEEKGHLVASLTEDDLADLPLGIAREVGGSTFVIAIDSAKRTRKGVWILSACAMVTFPGSTKPIAFRATNIAFDNKKGLVGTTQVKLLLAAPQRFAVTDKMDINLPSDGHNYIAFDCQGFKAINLKGEFIFDPGFLIPDTGADSTATTVKATFEVNTSDIHNMMTTVNITPFKIRGLEELAFEVRNAVVDCSDLVNPSGFSFPQDYQQTYGDDIKLWQGFYLQEVDIRVYGLSDDTTKVPTIAAHNLIIDNMGVSGYFAADNLPSFKDGSANGWPLNINHVHVQMLLNQVKGGGLGGQINIPFLGDDPIDFTASVEQAGKHLDYRFAVKTPDDKVFNAPFGAKIKVSKGSIIAIERIKKRLIPSAILHGAVTFEKDLLHVKDVKFQNLELTSVTPYMRGGQFSLITTEQSKSGGFPIHIDSITLKIAKGQFGIGFGVTINFMNSSDKSFSASTLIEVLVKMEEKKESPVSSEGATPNRRRQKWEFDKIRVNTIALDCETQAFKLKGSLSIYQDDPVYGTGYSGNLTLAIVPVLKDIKVNAYFGSKDTYRYWHLDAYVPIGRFPIYPPVLYMTGIMGGASYHMVRKQNFSLDFSRLNVPAATTPKGDEALAYVPDEKTGVGFMAGITMEVLREELVNGDIKLEIAFNTNGGLRYVQFDGSAFILTALNDRERSNGGSVPKAPIYVATSMIYDNENDMFHANSKTYINLMGVLSGVGPGGLVGEAVMHFDKKDWYIYVGRPSQMFGIQILSLVSVQTYFMTGTLIEDLPLPPVEVQEIFQGIDLRLMRDEVSTRGGKGLAAGFHFRVAFDSKDKLKPFYVQAAIGAGSDMMMRNYGNAQCEGRDGKIGINGWYASGQAYVFLEGRVGVKIKKRKFEILSLGAAALLQATLPNPAWMRGMLGGHYSVLGGLVKGKFNLKMVVGEQCEIINSGDELDDIKIISDLKPDGGGETSVFAAPQVSFNTPLDTQFSMVDTNDKLNDYRIKLSEFSVSKDGSKLNATLVWNGSNDVAVLHTAEILPAKTALKVFAKVYWEKKSDNGLWEAMKEETGGPIYYETKEATFTTGEAPPFIPEENVAYSYPVKNQYNLYVNESNQGYVKLNGGQDYLFTPKTEDGVSWDFVARFKDKKKGTVTDVPLTYETAKANVKFELPSALSQETVYTLTFIKRPQSSGAVDKNVQRSAVTTTSGDGNETSVTSNTLEGTVTQDVEKEIYSTAFRTSQFGKFEEKIASLQNVGNDIHDVAVGMTAIIFKRSALKETFDDIELLGKDDSHAPMIQIIATADNPWMKDNVAPLIYNSYPVDKDVTIKWRNPELLGVKPLKGVVLMNEADTKYRLTDANVTSGFAPAKSGNVVLGYFVSYYATHDYSELLDKAGAILVSSPNPPGGVYNILAGTYSDLIKGYAYPIEITYTLPGATEPSFKKLVTIKY